MDEKQVRDAYASIADLYIDLYGTSEQSLPADLAFIRRHLSIRPGTVLDVGCGPGHLTAYLRSLNVDAIGIDLVPEFIAHAKATHPTGTYHIGTMQSLDAADNSIAGILASYSLIHIPPQDLDEVLTELRRVLKPAGKLVAGLFDADDRTEPFDHKVARAYRWPIGEFSQRLAEAGFTEVEHERRPGSATHRPVAMIAALRAR
ncbi:hypothetical protein Asp14428_57920 [Actinoplanes sp. NBRC 14428]|nr:hypothetical protein Asp14428_57920 [Actinoplanes sp. NBRC 14428]